MRRIFIAILLGIGIMSSIEHSQAQDEGVNGVLGTAEVPMFARYHPDFAAVCAIEPFETLLAFAQTDELYLLYASGEGCEGAVWLPHDSLIAWEDSAALDDLPIIERPTATPLIELEDYATLCATATEAPPLSADEADIQHIFIAGGFSWFPPRFLATEDTPPDAVVCLEQTQESLGICANLNVRVERLREQLRVSLLSYPSGELITARQFSGGFPADCPTVAEREYTIHGAPIEREVWGVWLLNVLGAGGGETGFRTRTAVPRLNARALPNTQSDIITILEQGTPVNFIARNESGSWGVALLPDMQRAWLFVDFVDIAAQTDFEALPVVSGPAEEVTLTIP